MINTNNKYNYNYNILSTQGINGIAPGGPWIVRVRGSSTVEFEFEAEVVEVEVVVILWLVSFAVVVEGDLIEFSTILLDCDCDCDCSCSDSISVFNSCFIGKELFELNCVVWLSAVELVVGKVGEVVLYPSEEFELSLGVLDATILEEGSVFGVNAIPNGIFRCSKADEFGVITANPRPSGNKNRSEPWPPC